MNVYGTGVSRCTQSCRFADWVTMAENGDNKYFRYAGFELASFPVTGRLQYTHSCSYEIKKQYYGSHNEDHDGCR